jgi:hypothetical protein
MTGETTAGVATSPAESAPLAGAVAGETTAPLLPPVEEAAKAIEEARSVIAQAVAEVASDDVERLTRAYELAAGCADHVARALWFLRRAERIRGAK